MMAREKGIYIFMIKIKTLSPFLSSQCFLKEIETMFFMFLSSNTNTRESLGELEKAAGYGSCSHSISRSPKLPTRASIEQLDYELRFPSRIEIESE